MTLLNCPWPLAPEYPQLSREQVHAWCASLNQPVESYLDLLSEDEKIRAKRFLFHQDQRRFIVARGLLRTILGLYLEIAPGAIQFSYTKSGKPVLVEKTGGPNLCFNLSHSGDLVLIAFSHDRQIGIDLEKIRPVPDVMQLVSQFFSTEENAEFTTMPHDQKLIAFFSGWTRKEAYLKARGDGLFFPLSQFSVSLATEKNTCLLESHDEPGELSRWSLVSLTPVPVPGYIGALAVEGYDWKLVQWQMRFDENMENSNSY